MRETLYEVARPGIRCFVEVVDMCSGAIGVASWDVSHVIVWEEPVNRQMSIY
jgi:hypothetical protein